MIDTWDLMSIKHQSSNLKLLLRAILSNCCTNGDNGGITNGDRVLHALLKAHGILMSLTKYAFTRALQDGLRLKSQHAMYTAANTVVRGSRCSTHPSHHPWQQHTSPAQYHVMPLAAGVLSLQFLRTLSNMAAHS